MDEKIIEMIGSLGADGVTAFYVYLLVDAAEFILFLGAIVWGCRGLYPLLKKMIDEV